jgi:hypothetical protein
MSAAMIAASPVRSPILAPAPALLRVAHDTAAPATRTAPTLGRSSVRSATSITENRLLTGSSVTASHASPSCARLRSVRVASVPLPNEMKAAALARSTPEPSAISNPGPFGISICRGLYSAER